MLKNNYYWLLLLLPLGFLGWYFFSKNQQEPLRRLPYYGEKKAISKSDTNYHTVPAFYFIDQYGEAVTENTVRGKIYVTDYFFTTCQSICPIMSNYMEKVYEKYKDKNDLLFISHTVEPENDSIPVLARYAAEHGVKDKRWLFVTGEKKQLYDLARKGYLLNSDEGDGGADDFIHTQYFALVDKERHLRGFYDGTDSLEVNKLMIDIQLLSEEYAYREQQK